MSGVFAKLLKEFRHDHAELGRGFSELSSCLRARDANGAQATARRLQEVMGAHIGFEEAEFYPTLVPLLGEATVRRMRQEHCCGLDVVCTLLRRNPDLPLPPVLSARLLAQSEVMEEHIAECGDLFTALRDLPSFRQQELYEKLMAWRQSPDLDLERRTVCCGSLRLAECFPAALPPSAGVRSSVPIVEWYATDIGADERREATRLAARLIAADPALVTTDALDPRTGPGLENGPALYFEDHSDIRLLQDTTPLEYRARLLAGDGDIVLLKERRFPAFETYCRDVLGLGDPEVVVPEGPVGLSLPKRCAQDPRLLGRLCEHARRFGSFGLIPYFSAESAWLLASIVATQSMAPVWVAGPGPRLARRVNDKLWFNDCVAQLLGRRALPETHYVFGPGALARRVGYLARTCNRVCIKVPDSAGGAGNLVFDAKEIAELSFEPLAQFLLGKLRALGCNDDFPLLVGSWESSVVASPSVQIWIPHRAVGAPVIEGVFDQVVEEGVFVGAAPSELPESQTHRLVEEAARIAYLLQQLGYFGRCSFDSVVLSSGEVHWIECNGRWGGVSIPMTLLTRLTGDWQGRSFVIVQRSSTRVPARRFADVVDLLESRLYRAGCNPSGLILLTPDCFERGTGLHFMVLGDTKAQAVAEAGDIIRVLQENGQD